MEKSHRARCRTPLMPAQMLSTAYETRAHGRSHTLSPSSDCRTWHHPHHVHSCYWLGTSGTLGFRVLQPWSVWSGWRFHAVFGMVSSHIRIVGGYSRPSHVDSTKEFDPNSCIFGNRLSVHSPNHWQYIGKHSRPYGNVSHVRWFTDTTDFTLRMACLGRATW